MATLTTFTAATTIRSADVNANFVALNTQIAGAMRTGYASRATITNVLTGQDVLHTWTMPAGTMSATGDGYILRARVGFDANGNTKTLRFYPSRAASGTGGETAIVMNPTTAAPSGKYADVNILALYSSAGTGSLTISAMVVTGATAGTGGVLEYAGGTETVTHIGANARVVEFTGEATATGDILQDLMVIHTFKAAS